MFDILLIDILGDVDQSGLRRLREHLHLSAFGRLTDEFDQQFGSRTIECPSGHRAKIVLYREFDWSWQVQVVASTASSADELASLKAELLSGIRAANYSAKVEYESPPASTRSTTRDGER
ncbi:hypothetical protein [Mycobacterium sp. GA-2829]|uniref:hypothetical protein n=1 Tax=Mycobacterium sp. GA-2829 TaxID=1772283 RepID=UPI0009E6DE91|nr:hypothetical protein [Mycobacterium sp. GA-2829]